MKKNLTVLIFLCLMCSVGYAQRQVYVSSQANNSGDGSLERPFNKIQQAANNARAGDEINILKGVYYENVKVFKPGASGRPIIFKGETDAQGNQLTIVDGSKKMNGNGESGLVWKQDNSFTGGAVYYHTQNTEPWTLVMAQNDSTYDIPKLVNKSKPFNPEGRHSSSKYNGRKILNFSANYLSQTIYMDDKNNKGIAVNYWDGIEAVYYYDKDQKRVYLRFGDDRDPNGKMIRYATEASFLIDNQPYITIQDLKIRGGVSGVEINGKEAHHNKVENCYLTNGQQRILVVNGASNNEIANNTMRMQGVLPSDVNEPSFVGGAWSGGQDYRHAVKEHIYDVYKYEIGTGTSSPNEDCGVDMVGEGAPDGKKYQSAGNGNKIYGNDIAESLSAVEIKNVQDIEVYDNIIRNMSSMAVKVREPFTNIKIYDNLFYDVNFLTRLQEMQEEGQREVFFYRNRLWNEPGVGDRIVYAHFNRKRAGVPEGGTFTENKSRVYIYHNSFSGGGHDLGASDKIKLTGWYIINNVFSTKKGPQDKIKSLGKYDYNWVGGTGDFNGQSWYGSHNIRGNGPVWSNTSLPDFQLPEESTAIGAALDLSKTKINGRILPGFEEGYYNGPPDMGAIEFRSTPPPPPVTTLPEPDIAPIEAVYVPTDVPLTGYTEGTYWDSAPAYQFSDSATEASDNEVTVKALWNEQYLLVGVVVKDGEAVVNPADANKPWNNDGIELLLDVKNNNTSTWDTLQGHKQIVVDFAGHQHLNPTAWKEVEVVRGETTAEHPGHNYVIRILWDSLGVNPQDKPTIGIDIANNDREKDKLKTQFTYTGRITEFKVPGRFAKLILGKQSALQATPATSPITLDGKLDEAAWQSAEVRSYSFGASIFAQTVAQLLWDTDNLYVAFSVTDGSLATEVNPGKPWQNDGVELLLDIENNNAESWDTLQGHRQFIVDTKSNTHREPDTLAAIFGQVQNASFLSGYVVEMSIPWENLGAENPQAGKVMGIELVNNNRLGNGMVKSRTITGRSNDLGVDFKLPSAFADLVLVGSATARAGLGEKSAVAALEATIRQLVIYPNPSSEGNTRLQLSGFGAQAQVQVMDMKGNVVYQGIHSEPQIELTQRFSRGLYIVRVSDAQGPLTEKLLVE